MPSKFHEKAISRITAEERALMVKSIEIISQIHDILNEKGITQKRLAEMLNLSQASISKFLSPGGNLELNTIIRLELILNEMILCTPNKAIELAKRKDDQLVLERRNKGNGPFHTVWVEGQTRTTQIDPFDPSNETSLLTH